MAKAAQLHHPHPHPKESTPPEKIIASLFLKEVQVPPHVPPSSFILEESPPDPDPGILPLMWDETIPSKSEWTRILWETAAAFAGVLAIGGACYVAFVGLSRPTPPSPESMRLDTRIQDLVSQRSLNKPAQNPPSMTAESQPSSIEQGPAFVSVSYYSPTMVELTWEPAGDMYQYRLYSATTQSMSDALPETEAPIRNSYLAWEPTRQSSEMWLAVTRIDSNGQESPMGRPKYIRLR